MACRAAPSSSAAMAKRPAEGARGRTAEWMLFSAGRKEPRRPEPRRKRAPRAPFSVRGTASHRFVGEAANFFDVSTLDPDQPRGTVAARRVQVALVVEMGIARGQRVFLDQPYLPGLVFAGGLEQCPVAHYGLAA